MACGEGSKLSISQTQELLFKAQLLLRDIEELLDSAGASTDTSKQREERQTSTEQGVETLVIDGFMFLSAASRGDLEEARLLVQEDVRVTHD